jgi:predicted transcriptional regulator
MMDDKIERSISEFLTQESLQGRLESTAPEIAKGAKLVYTQVGRALERLIVKGKVGYRERGTDRKSVRYHYLRDIPELCKEKWEGMG